MHATDEEYMTAEQTSGATTATNEDLDSSKKSALESRIDLTRLKRLRRRLDMLIDGIKGKAFVPSGAKKPPVFSQVQLARLCNLSADAMARRLQKADELGLPAGEPVMRGTSDDSDGVFTGRRQWTLAEARQWINHIGSPYRRAPGTPGCVITTALFKGGVSKTFTTMSLAQGLTLLGYKVLAIDTDPQGSLTSLFGILPTEVDESMTILPLFQDPNSMEPLPDNLDDLPPDERPTQDEINARARKTIRESIRKTYWDGLDLVAANRLLHNADFLLPARQMRDRTFEFWNVVNNALDDGTRNEYDFILIDTPPSLSYLAVNMLWAADGLLMPLPPEGLDLASSSQYWSMVTELIEELDHGKPDDQCKKFDFVGVLPTKVDHTKARTLTALHWIKNGYEELVLPTEIPVTEVVNVGGTEFRTVYDITKYVGSAKTYQRARDAFDRLVLEIDQKARTTVWARHQGASASADPVQQG